MFPKGSIHHGNIEFQEKILRPIFIGKKAVYTAKGLEIDLDEWGRPICLDEIYKILRCERSANFQLVRDIARAAKTPRVARFFLPPAYIILGPMEGSKEKMDPVRAAIHVIHLTAQAMEKGSLGGHKITLEEARAIAEAAEHLRLAVDEGKEE